MSEKFILTAAEGAFKKDAETQRIAGKATPYGLKIAEASDYAEELDRYDDFASLKIKSSAYEKKEGTGEYGIERSGVHKLAFSPEVILEHQRKAVLGFLSDLRGFGLLADTVGSGKTFEASAALSELAARGKIGSLLVVCPEQMFETWKEVLELKFGLGKGVLQELTAPVFDDIEEAEIGNLTVKKPKRPAIVRMKDFAGWLDINPNVKDLLFDAVVVDEAHHLSSEEGEYAKAMKLLSLLMETKKRAGSTYCILLSATPHSGNLEKMFRLWYFIRCKGGNPSDFDDKDDKRRSEEYRREKEFYLSSVCRGAPTVAEYIAVSKKYELEGFGPYVPKFKAEFDGYIEKTVSGGRAAYKTKGEGEKRLIRDAYLNANSKSEGGPSIKEEVLTRIARAYHDGVMRSIMIRQPGRISKQRTAINYYIYPLAGSLPEEENYEYRGINFKADLKNLDSDEAFSFEGKKKSLSELIKYSGAANREDAEAEILISKILGRLGSFGGPLFPKKNSQKYYWEQIKAESGGQYIIDKISFAENYEGSVFGEKMKLLVKILGENKDERVIVFFDYDLREDSENYGEWARAREALQAYPEIFSRIIYAAAENDGKLSPGKKEEIIKEFALKKDAVLLVGDTSFTEGLNLQDGRTIINFQVTPDPLAMDQRIGRVFRLGQASDVNIHSFAAMNALEGYSLAYFNRIGLMHGANGDATIIAGSNNELMVAVQCPACGRVRLYTVLEYEERKKRDKLRCDAEERCRLANPDGTPMEEINVYEFRCDKCGESLTRGAGEEGYGCISTNATSRGKLNNFGGGGSRAYYCSKYCVITHCSRFREYIGDKCAIIARYKGRHEPQFSDCKVLCYKCPERGKACPEKCSMLHETMLESISKCSDCDYAECSPKPGSINFDETGRPNVRGAEDGSGRSFRGRSPRISGRPTTSGRITANPSAQTSSKRRKRPTT
jgi:Superfamily II DNA/RNA helicases, SNF2 family